MELLSLDFMRQALLAALLVGLAAPLVGIFLVQRRMSLIGDGMGHVALAGVAAGLLTGTEPVLTALIVTVLAAVAIELIRVRGHASADVALAVMFYSGIAVGLVLISKSSASSPANLTGYLFGAILTTSSADLIAFAIMAAVVFVATLVMRQRFFAVAHDQEFSQAVGLPVVRYNLILTVLTAVTVVVSMRVIGLLLISALMILPNAAAQVVSRSFAGMVRAGAVLGVVASLGGVMGSYYANTPAGASIVLVAVALFLALTLCAHLLGRLRRASHAEAQGHPHEHGPNCGHEVIAHDGHVDYVHDGHRHAAHAGHYDEHGLHNPGHRHDEGDECAGSRR